MSRSRSGSDASISSGLVKTSISGSSTPGRILKMKLHYLDPLKRHVPAEPVGALTAAPSHHGIKSSPMQGPYQLGFTLRVKVELANGTKKDYNLFIDSGSVLTWYEDENKRKQYEHASYNTQHTYRDGSKFRGVSKKAKIWLNASTQIEIDAQDVAEGLLYKLKKVPAQPEASSSSGQRQTRRSAPAAASAATETKEVYEHTSEMGDGMLGLANASKASDYVYHLVGGGEGEGFAVHTPISHLAATQDYDQIVGYYLTPFSKESEAEITFGGHNPEKVRGELIEKEMVNTPYCLWRLTSRITYGLSNAPDKIELVKTDTTTTVDTGAQYLGLPQAAFNKYIKEIGAEFKNDEYVISQEQFKKLKSLYFHIGNHELEYPPDAQVYPKDYNRLRNFSNEEYVLSVANSDKEVMFGLPVRKYSHIRRHAFDSHVHRPALLHSRG